MNEWYKIDKIEKIDSPSMVIYSGRIISNIQKAVTIAGNTNRLRPHVKTGKIREVYKMMLEAGICKFKCATIAEAEMLAMIKAQDVLMAYQPVGPKIIRLLNLVNAYADTSFSCLVDNYVSAEDIDRACRELNIVLDVYIDLNVGMDRTGIKPADAISFAGRIHCLQNLRLAGVHAYDGHIHESNLSQRSIEANRSYALADQVKRSIQPLFSHPLSIVIGGTPTFPVHIKQSECECSPGTFVFWDYGYNEILPDLPFQYAALVISRVISIIDNEHICIDLGYKSVASESPLPRIFFLNHPDAIPYSQSEEHMVLKVPDSSKFVVGDVFYGVPKHICPTVALYDKVFVVDSGKVQNTWLVIARNRLINY